MCEKITNSWLAKLEIDRFLKVGGITNEQARQCALICYESHNPVYQFEDLGDEDGGIGRLFTEKEKFMVFGWWYVKKQIIDYKFD